jgi:hypothetical protein
MRAENLQYDSLEQSESEIYALKPMAFDALRL